jgi:hypothetical protein
VISAQMITALTRLDELRPLATKRLVNEGESLAMFGMAQEAALEWRRQLAAGAHANTAQLMAKFRLANEPLQFVLDESKGLPTLRPLYKGTTTTAVTITGAVTLSSASVAFVANEAALLSLGGRDVTLRLLAWGRMNPAKALAATEMIIGFVSTADPSDYTWDNLVAVFSDPKSAALFTSQLALDLMHLRVAGYSDDGHVSPRAGQRSGSAGDSKVDAPSRGTAPRGPLPTPEIMELTPTEQATLRARVEQVRAELTKVSDAAKAAVPDPADANPRGANIDTVRPPDDSKPVDRGNAKPPAVPAKADDAMQTHVDAQQAKAPASASVAGDRKKIAVGDHDGQNAGRATAGGGNDVGGGNQSKAGVVTVADDGQAAHEIDGVNSSAQQKRVEASIEPVKQSNKPTTVATQQHVHEGEI